MSVPDSASMFLTSQFRYMHVIHTRVNRCDRFDISEIYTMQAHGHQRVAGRLPSRHSSALLCHARLHQGQSRRSRQNRRQLLVLSSSVVAPSFAIQSVDSAAAEELSTSPRRDVEHHSDSIVESIQNPPTYVKATGRIVASK